MKKLRDEFDLLLNSADPMEADMARQLLTEHGIPSMVAGPDFDVVELGRAAHGVTRHPDLYVPKGTKVAARAILAEAWGEERLLRLDPQNLDPQAGQAGI